jgi:hypothetical protein
MALPGPLQPSHQPLFVLPSAMHLSAPLGPRLGSHKACPREQQALWAQSLEPTPSVPSPPGCSWVSLPPSQMGLGELLQVEGTQEPPHSAPPSLHSARGEEKWRGRAPNLSTEAHQVLPVYTAISGPKRRTPEEACLLVSLQGREVGRDLGSSPRQSGEERSRL